MLLTMIRTSGMLAQVCTVLCCAHMLACARLSLMKLYLSSLALALAGLAWSLSYFNNDNATTRNFVECDMMLHVVCCAMHA